MQARPAEGIGPVRNLGRPHGEANLPQVRSDVETVDNALEW